MLKENLLEDALFYSNNDIELENDISRSKYFDQVIYPAILQRAKVYLALRRVSEGLEDITTYLKKYNPQI